MNKLEIKNKETHIEFKQKLLLASREKNILPFRLLCEHYGAGAVFSKEINSKKDIDFQKKENIIACINVAKNLEDLQKNEGVKAICVKATSKDFNKIIEKNTKPLIVEIDENYDFKKIKNANAILVNFNEKTQEINLDNNFINEIKTKLKVPVLVKAKFETPEEMYNALKKSEADAIVLGDIAFRQPVIFEQTVNYFEKGYYNKITRKRREKTVKAFEKFSKNYENIEGINLEEFKRVFMED